MQEIQRMTARERHRRQVRTYRALITVTEQVVAEARAVVTRTVRVRRLDPLMHVKVDALRSEIARHCELGDRVISQTRRRVLDGEQVPTADKLYSIFETHTNISNAARCSPRSSSVTRCSWPRAGTG